MKKLLRDPEGFCTPKVRPSGHDIGWSFAKDNGGAVPSNLLKIANTESNGQYLSGCKVAGARPHPARFPAKLPEFFIRFLTDPGDIVLDIFAGSNTTGFVAEHLGRRWLAFEASREYLAASVFRFLRRETGPKTMKYINAQIERGVPVDLSRHSTSTQIRQAR
jgi:site-specific DNA-methyltransferase (cytosine-N4-specific)